MKTGYFLAALLGGLAGAVLRGLALLHGYEPQTGLPVRGYLPSVLLAGLTAAMMIGLVLAAWAAFRRENGCTYETMFGSGGRLSGLLDVLAAAGMMACAGYALTHRTQIIFEQSSSVHGEWIEPNTMIAAAAVAIWALGLLAGAALLVFGVRRMMGKAIARTDGTCLLVPMFWGCLDLIMIYHENSGNPVLSQYSYFMLMVIAVLVVFYSIAAFLFAGKPSAVRYFAASGIMLQLALTHIGGIAVYHGMTAAPDGVFSVVNLSNLLRIGVYTCMTVYLLVFFVQAVRNNKTT